MLNEAGFPNAKIVASSDLDEDVIWDLKAQGAAIDVWGVGTAMITSKNCPALGGVYKLVAEEVNGELVPKIKISENAFKITNPGYKKVFRLYDKETHKAIADLITLDHETIDETKPLTIFDPVDTWKRMTLTNFKARQLLVPIYRKGSGFMSCHPLWTFRSMQKEMSTLWAEYKRLTKPHVYKVDLSVELYNLKNRLLEEYSFKK